MKLSILLVSLAEEYGVKPVRGQRLLKLLMLYRLLPQFLEVGLPSLYQQ